MCWVGAKSLLHALSSSVHSIKKKSFPSIKAINKQYGRVEDINACPLWHSSVVWPIDQILTHRLPVPKSVSWKII